MATAGIHDRLNELASGCCFVGERDEESRRCVPCKSTEENTWEKRYKTTQNYLTTDHITKYGDVIASCSFYYETF